MTYLTEHLPFASSSNQALPQTGSHLLISDTLPSPGYFAIYHLISAAILDKRKIIWVDLKGQGRLNLEMALKKMGTNLPTTNTKLFTTISPSSLPTPPGGTPALFDEDCNSTLRPTWDAVIKETSDNQSTLIILDGLVELTYLGFEPKEISRFVRAILAHVRKTGSSLVSTTHADHLPLLASSPNTISGPEAELLRRLLRVSNGWWRISGLSSGRSGNVSGEISSHALLPLEVGSSVKAFPAVPRSSPLQYRLESNTVKLFAKGTGRGYL